MLYHCFTMGRYLEITDVCSLMLNEPVVQKLDRGSSLRFRPFLVTDNRSSLVWFDTWRGCLCAAASYFFFAGTHLKMLFDQFGCHKPRDAWNFQRITRAMALVAFYVVPPLVALNKFKNIFS